MIITHHPIRGQGAMGGATPHNKCMVIEMKSYWFDPQHTGALRIIDHTFKTIRGSDSNGIEWEVSFDDLSNNNGEKSIIVDFSKKKGHRGRQKIKANYGHRKNELLWEDGNVWKRIRVPWGIISS